MINTIIKILVIIFIVILQFTLMPLLAIKGVWPNLLLISIVVLMLIEYADDALLFACIAGMIVDLAGPLRYGINTIFLCSIYFMIKFLLKKYISEINILVLIILITLVTVLYSLYIGFIVGINPNQFIIYQVLYNCIIAIGIYYLISMFNLQKLIIKIENI